MSKVDWLQPVHPAEDRARTASAGRPTGEVLPVSVLVPQQRRASTPLALAALPPAAVMSVRAAYAREVAAGCPRSKPLCLP